MLRGQTGKVWFPDWMCSGKGEGWTRAVVSIHSVPDLKHGYHIPFLIKFTKIIFSIDKSPECTNAKCTNAISQLLSSLICRQPDPQSLKLLKLKNRNDNIEFIMLIFQLNPQLEMAKKLNVIYKTAKSWLVMYLLKDALTEKIIKLS